MNINWNELQNGSDIRGIALPGIEGEDVNLTPDVVKTISKAFATWLCSEKGTSLEKLKIGVGCDSRLTGTELSAACFNGLNEVGIKAFDCGLASTPAMFMSTIFPEMMYDGAIMLTASHLPYNRNGLKFFTNKGGLDKSDISQILNLCAEGNFPSYKVTNHILKVDLLDRYSAFLIESIRKGVNNTENYNKPLLGFHIVVDAGNGSGGFFAEKVLVPLGADISGSQFLNPDGNFPNHIPNPEDKTAMASICSAVKSNNADLGIIFDTDVDRSAAVDKWGNEINRNKLIGLISSIILEEHPGTAIVTDSITSDGLTEFIEQQLKGKHHRYKRGYKNVINEAIRLNQMGEECWCAIETSGHAALKENRFLDDGAFLITKILIKAAQLKRVEQTIDTITEKLKLPYESEEFRIKVKTADFKDYGNLIIKDLESFVSKIEGWSVVPNNYEGIRVSCAQNAGNGWFLLRLSLHDPVIPLNIESVEEGGVGFIASKLAIFAASYEMLDISTINNYIN